jgi:hypothetical protein
MMRIIDRLPIAEKGWIVPTPDGAEEVRPYQIIVMVSITDQEVVELPQDALRIPAILDTGNNHNFAIRQGQLERWGPITLPGQGRIEVGGSIVPLVAANIWIQPNQAGTIEPSGQAPLLLKLKGGIAVYPPEMPNPARLPILGLRAIIRNGLKLTIDGATRELTIDSPSP